MCALLQNVRREADIVVDYDIARRLDRALQTNMRLRKYYLQSKTESANLWRATNLEVEFKQECVRDAFVYDGSGKCIPIG